MRPIQDQDNETRESSQTEPDTESPAFHPKQRASILVNGASSVEMYEETLTSALPFPKMEE